MNRLKFLLASAYLYAGLIATGWLFERRRPTETVTCRARGCNQFWERNKPSWNRVEASWDYCPEHAKDLNELLKRMREAE